MNQEEAASWAELSLWVSVPSGPHTCLGLPGLGWEKLWKVGGQPALPCARLMVVSPGHVHFGVVCWLSGVCSTCFFSVSSVLAVSPPGTRIAI